MATRIKYELVDEDLSKLFPSTPTAKIAHYFASLGINISESSLENRAKKLGIFKANARKDILIMEENNPVFSRIKSEFGKLSGPISKNRAKTIFGNLNIRVSAKDFAILVNMGVIKLESKPQADDTLITSSPALKYWGFK
jgi:hypothetical protein